MVADDNILTRREARRFLLAHHHLIPPRRLKSCEGILNFIRHVGCIQFDPLNIVGRNAELVLQSRVADFRPHHLNELLYRERRLLEGYDKMMAIYPLEDWPHFQRHRQRAGRRQIEDPTGNILNMVRNALEEKGPSSSIDLDFDTVVDWSWGPTRLARAALESLFFRGELVVHHRVGTRRVYDFAHKHIPSSVLHNGDPHVTDESFRDWQVKRRIGGVGLLRDRASDAWLAIPGLKKGGRSASLARLTAAEHVFPIRVQGLADTFYMRIEDKGTLDKILRGPTSGSHASILAPLDNLLWDRRMISELFGFDYVWEVYKPVSQRRYGYYVLPVLYGDKFVARFEPGRDKADGSLIIRNWWWEPDVRPSQRMFSALSTCIRSFLRYLECKRLKIDSAAREQRDLLWLADLL